jgi:hypothetical protein
VGGQQNKPCCRTCLFSHGGVSLIGAELLCDGRDLPKVFIVSCGPVNLDIRPLSPYRKQLLDAIDALRIKSWSDRQIADHFNLMGWLTPRGHRWLPQSVFSMRKKRAMALAVIG